MVIFVVVHNILFGLACLMVARRLWKFRCKLISITNTIIYVEQAVYNVLYPAPHAIYKAQSSTSQLRDRYQQLGVQFERVQKILSLLSVGQALWRYRPKGRR